jgi:hypothetical protein
MIGVANANDDASGTNTLTNAGAVEIYTLDGFGIWVLDRKSERVEKQEISLVVPIHGWR